MKIFLSIIIFLFYSTSSAQEKSIFLVEEKQIQSGIEEVLNDQL